MTLNNTFHSCTAGRLTVHATYIYTHTYIPLSVPPLRFVSGHKLAAQNVVKMHV